MRDILTWTLIVASLLLTTIVPAAAIIAVAGLIKESVDFYTAQRPLPQTPVDDTLKAEVEKLQSEVAALLLANGMKKLK